MFFTIVVALCKIKKVSSSTKVSSGEPDTNIESVEVLVSQESEFPAIPNSKVKWRCFFDNVQETLALTENHRM